jgi:ferric-dicitrate binding protein FerR (iron transport regulator)
MNSQRSNAKTSYVYRLGILFFLLSLFGLIAPPASPAQQGPVSVAMANGNARITLLTGKAYLSREGGRKSKPLKTNDVVRQGDTIQTGENARIEILLPDKSYIRFGENTKFFLEAASLNQKERTRDISIRMLLGKVWAKASKLFSGRGRFAISTRTAVAGVRGTVYRMNVNEDSSAVVKVYYGEVLVSSKEQAETQKGLQPAAGPKPMAGPHPIPGPHAVSLKEWMHIVSSMQQILIKSDGTASKPFRFSPEADEDEWVHWNKKRDEKIDSETE